MSERRENPKLESAGSAVDLGSEDTSFDALLREAAETPPVISARSIGPGSLLAGGRFVIEKKLGEGGMGVVFEARDTKSGGRVALKTLSRVDAAGIYRLKKEFRALCDVVHENLVGLHELFAEGDLWFFTMELVEGIPLTEYLWQKEDPKTGILSDRPVRDLFRELATGVSALHRAEKLHRDLKPSNVLVDRTGRVVILDFGLARDVGRARADQTVEEGVLGTPTYMAPEQARGGAATEASDWYAVGIMLFEVLTGQPPFAGNALEVLLEKSRREAPRPSSCTPRVAPYLDALAAELLARDPAERPSGTEILARLGAGQEAASEPIAETAAAEPSFVGRSVELQALERAFSEAMTRDRPSVALVSGPSGIGKSALVGRFLSGLSESCVVLAGRCHAMESVPFKVFDGVIDALSRHLARLSPTDAAMRLPRDIGALAEIFPALARLDVIGRAASRPAPLDPFERRKRAGFALKELLARIGDQSPLVVFVDDLQWGDRDSAGLFYDVMMPPDAPRMLFVAAHRPETGVVIDAIAQAAEAAIPVDRIELGALDDDAARSLAKRAAGAATLSDSVVNGILHDAQGSPLYLLELGHSFASHGESSGGALDELLLGRAQGLGADARCLLELASVAGRPVDTAVLASALGSKADLTSSFRALRVGRWLKANGGDGADRVEPYHDRVREVVVAALERDTVAARHRALAWALVERGSDDDAALVDHLEAAGDIAQAFDQAVLAARRAEAKFAFDQAGQLYERALSHAPDKAARTLLLRPAADALSSAGQGQRTSELYLELAETAGEDEARELNLLAAAVLVNCGGRQRGIELYRRALAAEGVDLPEDPTQAFMEGLSQLREIDAAPFDFVARSGELSGRSRRVLKALGTVSGILLSRSLGHALCTTGAYVREAIEAGSAGYASIAFGLVSVMSWVVGMNELAERALERAEAFASSAEDDEIEASLRERGRIAIIGARMYREVAATRFDKALELCDHFLARTEVAQKNFPEDFRLSAPYTLLGVRAGWLLDHLYFAGRINEMRRLQAEIVRDARARGDDLSEQTAHCRGVLHACVDQPEVGVTQARRALESKEWVISVTAVVSALCSLAYAGRYEEGVALQDERQASIDALTFAVPRAAYRPLSARSMLFGPLLLTGRADSTRARLELEAVLEQLASDERPFPRGIARLTEAALALAIGRRDRAIEAVAMAVDSYADVHRPGRAAARWALGELRGDAEGAELVRQARSDSVTMGVKNPEKLARLLTFGIVGHTGDGT